MNPEALNLLGARPPKGDKIKFECFYCEATFEQFKDAVAHYLQEHHQNRRGDKR